MTKLNLGSGLKRREGYVNVDKRPEGKPDMVADIRDVEFKDGEFEEILVFDVIEHVSFVDAKKLLRNCYGWLEPGGAIQIHTQNMRFIARALADGDDGEALRWVYGTLGEGDTDYDGGYHKWGYTKTSLSEMLENIGFTVIDSEEDSLGYGLRITAAKK